MRWYINILLVDTTEMRHILVKRWVKREMAPKWGSLPPDTEGLVNLHIEAVQDMNTYDTVTIWVL